MDENKSEQENADSVTTEQTVVIDSKTEKTTKRKAKLRIALSIVLFSILPIVTIPSILTIAYSGINFKEFLIRRTGKIYERARNRQVFGMGANG